MIYPGSPLDAQSILFYPCIFSTILLSSILFADKSISLPSPLPSFILISSHTLVHTILFLLLPCFSLWPFHSAYQSSDWLFLLLFVVGSSSQAGKGQAAAPQSVMSSPRATPTLHQPPSLTVCKWDQIQQREIDREGLKEGDKVIPVHGR